jgi:hypothetical protein
MYLKTKNNKNARKGRSYEYYISWSLRRDGWEVQPRGKYGYFDRGIDIVASRGGITRYIQCKGWKKRYEIHEDVFNQFYGSVVSQAGAENLSNIEMYIYSPATPTNYAKAAADKLNIHFIRKNFYFWHRKKKS